MNPRARHGLTLVEMLVAIAVMGVVMAAATATVTSALRLHNDLQSRGNWISDRCALAEQLTADFRANQGVHPLPGGQWSIARADGIEAQYAREGNRVIRSLAGNSNKKIYSVGTFELSWPATTPDLALRIKFPDMELVLTK